MESSVRGKPSYSKLTAFIALVFITQIAMWSTPSFAENLQLSYLSTEQGLSNNGIGLKGNAIIQDQRGFLWVGTQDGLNRYDGYQFKVYQHNPEDKQSLSGNFILSLYEDQSGIIWVGTKGGGLSRFDPTTESFSRYPLSDGSTALPVGNFINSIFEIQPGILWVATGSDGLYELNIKEGTRIIYQHDKENPNSISENMVRDFYQDQAGTLWVATKAGLSQYRPETKDFENYYLPDKNSNASLKGVINALFEDSEKNFWVGTTLGLWRFNRETLRFERPQLDTPEQYLTSADVASVVEDELGRLWVGFFGEGLGLFEPNKKQVTYVRQSDQTEGGLRNDYISYLYQDQQKRIWVGTIGGLHYFSPNNPFKFISHSIPMNGQFVQKPILSLLAENNGNLWTGAFGGGLSLRSPKSKNQTFFLQDKNDPSSISSNRVVSIFRDSQNTLWVGTFAGGLNSIDETEMRAIHWNSPSKISSIHEDKKGRLWLGSVGEGLGYFDRATKSFVAYKDLEQFPSVTTILSDEDNTLWVGSTEGLLHVKPDDNSFIHYTNNSNDKKSLSSNFIMYLYRAKSGDLWIATMDGGLNRLIDDSGTFQRYRKEYLPSETVYSIVEDHQGRLWLSTNNGITSLDPQTGISRNYQTDDGLYSNVFHQGAFTQNSKGDIFFGGDAGITYFSPEEVAAELSPPPVTFTDFKLFNKSVPVGLSLEDDEFRLPKSINYLDQLDLSYRERFFSFEFAAALPLKPKKIMYSYKLNGWDNDWVETSHENRIATYTNIPAGSYELLVKASDPNRDWKDSTKSIKIHISPPPWKTTWAYTVYLLVLLLLTWGIIKARTRWLQVRARELERIIEQRTHEIDTQKKTIEALLAKKDKLFANVSHEFRTPLTLIIGPITAVINETKNKGIKTALNPTLINAKRLLRMVDQLLDFSRLDYNALDKQSRLDISHSSTQILSFFDSAIKERELTLSLAIEPNIIAPISADSFEKIIVNLVSNAIKYSIKGGNIHFSCTTKSDQCQISIADNGVGIAVENQEKIFERFTRIVQPEDKNIPGAGIGLALVKELIENYDGHIQVESRLGEGTCFTVTLPQHISSDTSSTEVTNNDNALQEIAYLNDNQSTVSDTTKTDNWEEDNLPRLLIIEDNPDMQAFIKDNLQAHFNCLTAFDGAKGIEIAISKVPDLIITDLMMPLKDGFDVAKTLRDDTRTSHIPIIMLTAKADIDSRKKAWQTDIDEYFEKPFNTEELLVRCQNLLAIRQIISDKLKGSDIHDNRNAISLLNPRDQKFVSTLESIVEQRYDDSELDAAFISDALNMSKSQLQRKMKALIGQSLPQYIRNYRLKKAAERLINGDTITDVAFDVGFASYTYFSSCFKAYYNMTPKEYQQLRHENLEISEEPS